MACEVVGAPIVVVSCLGSWLACQDWEDSCDEYDMYRERCDDDSETKAVVAGASLAGLLAGGALFGLAEAVKPDEEQDMLLPGEPFHLDLTALTRDAEPPVGAEGGRGVPRGCIRR